MMQHVDTLIQGGSAITMDPTRRIIRDAAIAIDDGRIVAVGKRADLVGAYTAGRTIDGTGRVTTPGLVNSHIHFYHHLHRGMAPDDVDGSDWSDYVHSSFAPHITADDEVASAYLVLTELAKSGTTSFLAAGSYHPGPVLEAISTFGLRGFEGRRTFDHNQLGHAVLMDDTETAIKRNREVMENYADSLKDNTVKPCVNIVGMGRCTDELIVAAKELADEFGTMLNMHLCAFEQEIGTVRERVGMTPVEHLDSLGVLGPNLVLAHMVHVADHEIELLASSKTNVVFNPGTALKLVYGLSKSGKFPEMLDAGVNVALGTDAGDCANFMDMVRAMHLAAVLFKDIRHDPTVMGVETALEMATLNGARALGLQDEIGSIEVGKRADLVMFDSDRPEWQPLYCEPYNLVLSATGTSADTVLVNGEPILESGVLSTIDEAEVIDRIKASAERMVRESGRTGPTSWPVV